MTASKEEYITISVFNCMACNETGKIKNDMFEYCQTEEGLKELELEKAGDCKKCGMYGECLEGEIIICPVCDGASQLLVSHGSFQPAGILIIKKRNE